jgi:hypothetical protein
MANMPSLKYGKYAINLFLMNQKSVETKNRKKLWSGLKAF